MEEFWQEVLDIEDPWKVSGVSLEGGDVGKENISDFSRDFGTAYISRIRKNFPSAKITGDRFHLVKMANTALNDTKCEEIKLAVNRIKAKYLLLRNSSDLSPEEKEMRDRICMDNEVLGIAYRLKESLCSTYLLGDAYAAADHLTGWIRWARMTRLYHFVALADTVEKHMALIKSRARGFKRAENLISMCYLVSAQEKTDLYGRGVCSSGRARNRFHSNQRRTFS